MAVAQGIPLFVAHCLEELVDPDRSIYGETLAVECRKIGRPSARLYDCPKPVDSHCDGDLGLNGSSGVKGVEGDLREIGKVCLPEASFAASAGP